MSDDDRPSSSIEGLHPAASELPWSSSFVMQAIELLPVTLLESAILLLQPDHAESFVIGWPAGERPEQVAAEALHHLGLEAVVLHSTSWRHRDAEVVLTYLAVVESSAIPGSWEAVPVGRTDLARGGTTASPPIIGVHHVVEHALRHLSWLIQDDPVIKASLPDWSGVLADYKPEPFRALGEVAPLS